MFSLWIVDIRKSSAITSYVNVRPIMVSGCGTRVNCEKAVENPLDPDVMGIGVRHL